MQAAMQDIAAPLTEEQLSFVLLILKELPQDWRQDKSFELICRCMVKYNSSWARVAVTANVKACLRYAASSATAGWFAGLTRLNVKDMLRTEGGYLVAGPVTQQCSVCGHTELQRLEVKQATWFYSSTLGSGRGTLYELHCKKCQCVHQVDGYMPCDSQSTVHGRKCKYPYNPALQHRRWYQSTEMTVLDVDMFERYSQDLLHKHSSFQAFTAVENHMMTQLASPTPEVSTGTVSSGTSRQQSRQLLTQKRFTEAFLRYSMVKLGFSICPDVIAATDLNAPLDGLIEAVCK